MLVTFWQATQNFLGMSEDPCMLVGKCFNEKTMLPLLEQTHNFTPIAMSYLNRLMLCYMFGNYHQALKSADQVEKYKYALTGIVPLPVAYFYDSLIRLQMFQQKDASEQAQILKKVSGNQRELKFLADHAPMNQLHRYCLVEAEYMRVTGQDIMVTINCYDQAISLAGSNEYIQEEALANELAARFWLEKNKENIARLYMRRAHRGYSKWGAVRKVKDLEDRYVSLLILKSEMEEAATPLERLDLSTLIKATHAISSEIEMQKLLNLVVHSVIENAGAQHGYLLMEKYGGWTVIAQGEINRKEVEISSQVNIDESNMVSPGVVHFVARTKNKVVLDNAVLQGEFTTDPYIRNENTRSVLCAPMLHRGKLISILYLENNLTTCAFTPDRVQFLEMLLSQVAISLENSTIYEALRKSETKYRMIVETANEGVMAIGPDDRVSFANNRIVQMLGYSIEEIFRQPATALVPQEDWPDLEKRIENSRHGVSETFEFRSLRKDWRII